jgi:hypothetical protein
MGPSTDPDELKIHLKGRAAIIAIDGESYRKREAEQAQKRKQEQKPKR